MYDRSYWQAAEYAADHPDQAPETHVCEMEGCQQEGLFKAPKSPKELRSYRWFCQAHIQEYNKAWNYFAGLNASQMEHVHREDVVGWRPTWPLGTLRGQGGNGIPQMDVNALRKHIFRRFFSGKMDGNASTPKHAGIKLLPEEQQALNRLGLTWPISLYEVKARYRELVKKHHPDAVQDKSAADETIKLINRAYAVLKRKLSKKV